MKVGISFSNRKDAFVSGREIAESALKSCAILRPDFVFSFCGSNVDHDEYFRGLQSVIGIEVPIIGGSAIGILTNDYLSYEGYPAGAAILQSDTLRPGIAVAGELNRDEKLAGKKVAEKLLHKTGDKPLFIFYDSIKQPATDISPPVMNASSPLIEGIEEIFESPLPVLGAGLVGDYEFKPVKLFCGSYVASQSVVGFTLNGDFKTCFRIMHGCTPLDGIYHTITKIEGDVVYEVDGKSIVEMIDAIYGHQNWRNQHPLQLISLGINYGDRFEIPRETNYVNRLITGCLPDGKGVGLFEPDLEEGTEIQFMLRDTGEMINSAKNNSEALMKEIESRGEKAVFGLYIDCAGRTAKASITIIEETSEVQKVFNLYHTPLFGFYSGVEIAPFIGKNRGLDWTGVLIIFTEG